MGNVLARLLGAALLITICLSVSYAQESSEAMEVRALELKVADCYLHHQIEAFAPILDNDFVITFEDGTVYSKTGYLAYSARASTVVEVVEIPEMRVHMHGDTAVVTGVYHERGVEKEGPYNYRDRFTDVWMKKSGKWRLVAAHYALPTK
jgi:ketosteroid isomerase-like protein